MKARTKAWIVELSDDNVVLRKELNRLNDIVWGDQSSKESSRHNTLEVQNN